MADDLNKNRNKRINKNSKYEKNSNDIKISERHSFSSISLKDCEEKFKAFLNADEDLIFILDEAGCFNTVNEIGPAALEYISEELLGKHFIELVAARKKSDTAQAFQKILQEKNLISFSTILLSKFGKELFYEINAQAIHNNNKVEGLLAVGKNVTQIQYQEEKVKEINTKLVEVNRLLLIERNRANQRKSVLEELNRLKGEFISNISHELRTPLASIIGFSETIEGDPNMPPEMKNEFNHIILMEGKRLAKLINDVLDVSQVKGAAVDLNKSEFDCIELLTELAESQKRFMEEKNIVFSFNIPDEKALIYADPDKILQAFTSVINNALKFTKEGGRISLIAQNLYKEFEVIITDTGIGIPEKDLPQIFDKFYRVSRPGNEYPGSGLGLVFVKQIVDLHRGLIKIESETGKGTSVIIKLPKSIKLKKS